VCGMVECEYVCVAEELFMHNLEVADQVVRLSDPLEHFREYILSTGREEHGEHHGIAFCPCPVI